MLTLENQLFKTKWNIQHCSKNTSINKNYRETEITVKWQQ